MNTDSLARNPQLYARNKWRVLIVDDDPLFQQSMTFVLRDLEVLGCPLELIHASSYVEASAILANEDDIAIVLLDIVMETEDAGFRLVETVRDVIGNAEIQIIVLTGQPGNSDMRSSVDKYDINDYWDKSKIDAERLRALMTASCRSYEQIRTTSRARRGLQLIAESGHAAGQSRDLNEYASRILFDLAKLLKVEAEGLVCLSTNRSSIDGDDATIVGAAGGFADLIGKPLAQLPNSKIAEAFRSAAGDRTSRFSADYTLLYFPSEVAGADYAAFVGTGRRLDATEVELLKVFALNAGIGLHNVALFSRLDETAYQDPLLGIPNQNSLLRFLARHKDRPDWQLILVDIDRFSEQNLALGTQYGDTLLRNLVDRLKSGLDPEVFLARLQDDLFALVGPEDKLDVQALAYHISPPDKREREIMSFGTATFRLGEPCPEAFQLVTLTRLAMRETKKKGIGHHTVANTDLLPAAEKRYHLMSSLNQALDEEGLSIALQPQVDLRTGRAIGLEALARWVRPDGSMVSPGEFIPMAETTGMIRRLGDQVLRLTIKAAVSLREKGIRDIPIGFNVSVLQLLDDGFAERLEHRLKEAELDASALELELTESVAMQNFAHVEAVLSSVRQMGVRVAIDDFGTGFSSLQYLERLPADRLKIDRAFVQETGSSGRSFSIAGTIIDLARRLNLEVIAEGVETTEQAQWLIAHESFAGQGWLYAKAMHLDEAVAWIKGHS